MSFGETAPAQGVCYVCRATGWAARRGPAVAGLFRAAFLRTERAPLDAPGLSSDLCRDSDRLRRPAGNAPTHADGSDRLTPFTIITPNRRETPRPPTSPSSAGSSAFTSARLTSSTCTRPAALSSVHHDRGPQRPPAPAPRRSTSRPCTTCWPRPSRCRCGKPRVVRRTVLDTFDRRLERAGQRLQLVAEAGEERLELVQGGETLVSVLAGTGPRWPAMAGALPDGTLKDHVARLAGHPRPARRRRAPTAGAPRRAAQRGRQDRRAPRRRRARRRRRRAAAGGHRAAAARLPEGGRPGVAAGHDPARARPGRAGRAPGRESLGGRPRVACACAARRRADRLPPGGARQPPGHDRRR